MEADTTEEFFKLRPGFYKKLHYGAGCVNFLVLLIITISPYWLGYSAEENNFTMGVWTYCFQKKCGLVSARSVYLFLVRALLIIAIGCGLTALITSWTSFSHCLKENTDKAMMSFVTNFIAAICMLTALVIIYTKLRTSVDDAVLLSPCQDFFLGCFVFVLFFALATVNLWWYMHLVSAQKKAATQITPAEEAP
ncbi:uncharacterized protein LOC114603495 [Podarcis muralis]